MPKVVSYTPAWLARPTPGYHLFAPKQTTGTGAGVAAKKQEAGARRTIATRGSEIFVAAGNELRWADLANVKEGTTPAYRCLKVPLPLPITRLTISPDGDYLAVSTSHTVHVVSLPDSSHLASGDDSPIKPKTFQVGPTAHVLEESPIATTLWHPLGWHGRCLVTITKAGVVRLWEVNRADRSTFNEPTLSIDLPKLANATTDQEDLSASKYGASKGFSPDSVELEVASACFGDFAEHEGVHGWAPTTLWIATVSGDVYALCPLLPSKWQLVESHGSFTFLQTLASSININYADLSEDANAPKYDVKTAEKQVAWLADIIYEEPFVEELPDGDSVKVFARPTSTPAVPLLQGPFTITPEVDDFELSDMIVFSLKTFSDGTEDEAAEGLPTAVVCLLTDTCKVHVCLNLEGVGGRWLPSPEDNVDITDVAEPELIIAETIALTRDEQSSFTQSITPDVHTDFSFFVSHAAGVHYVSLEPWIRKLENELSEPQTDGAEFRLQRLLESASSSVDQYIVRKPSSNADRNVPACVVIEDGNIGYLLLTTVANEPVAALLDAPETGLPTNDELAEFLSVPGAPAEVREAWQPSQDLYTPFDLLKSIKIPSRHRALLKEEIRLSPANLELLMDVHRTLSAHTARLQAAVADLFNRATQLQDVFRDQITRSATVAQRIEAATTSVDDEGDAAIEARMQKVQARQQAITARYEALRRKMSTINSTELSDKEASYIDELQTMSGAVDKENRTLTGDVDGTVVPAWQRIEKLKQLKQELKTHLPDPAGEAHKQNPGNGYKDGDGAKISIQARKAETDAIYRLLQRNTDLVDVAMTRLRGLGVAVGTGGQGS